MRAGANCSVHQSLTPEALGVVKLAITLARRRGHAQVTPLHVASTMLASTSCQLRIACLQSNSHPLQCKALELCFNVALNRLPVLAPHHPPSHNHPTISNSLVAAFKRAQAHQRRGSIESQQQPILAVKIVLEQLVISILDDPSVSRVMKEAGFSSTQVKSNVGRSSCIGHSKLDKPKSSNQVTNHEDLMALIDSMMLRKSIVIIGECHEIFGSLMDKVDRGEVPQEMKQMKFISFPLHSIENRSRVEVEKKLDELKTLVQSCVEKGVALYLGDLKWITDFGISHDHDSNEVGRSIGKDYCPVEHTAIEIGRLVQGIRNGEKFWLLAMATFHTFMRCKNGNPSLETLWGLHPLNIPQGSLDLSLLTSKRELNIMKRSGDDQYIQWVSPQGTINGADDHQLTCCAECSSNFEAEARSLKNNDATTLSTLPTWLQQYKKENQKLDKDSMQVKELSQKWSLYCNSFHKQPKISEKTINFSFISSTYPISGFSGNRDQNPSSEDTQKVIFSNPNSTTSSDIVMETHDYVKSFKELNPRNIDILSNALEKKVPWQKDILPPIVSTILKCRSGMMRRKVSVAKEDGDVSGEIKEETWLLFQGMDLTAKEIIARELARLIFGSETNLVTIALSSFSYSSEDLMIRNKRLRDEPSSGYLERFAEAMATNPHRVFLIEEVEEADHCSQMGIKNAIESGRMKCSSIKETSLSDAIIILSCETISCSRAFSPPTKMKLTGNGIEEEEISHCLALDLNTYCNEDDNEDDRSIDHYIELSAFVDKQIVFKS